MAGKPKDLRGRRFGKLVVVEDAGRKFGSVLWRCRCDCGKVVDIRASALVCGDNKSCGSYGECHHAWLGGKTKGSLAWARSKIHSSIAKSRERGHAPITDSAERVVEAWEKADGQCEICGSKERLCVDHCHSTGSVRGILCASCNSMVGYCQDDKERLQRTIDYLHKAEL